MMNNTLPWIEKYRPQTLQHTVLDEMNERILTNLLQETFIPNILLYGEPGTGKTTTIMNFIKKYQERNNGTFKQSSILHLNASDERGIQDIRDKIRVFVRSSSLYNEKVKFIILDEVDYMTQEAQDILANIIELYEHKTQTNSSQQQQQQQQTSTQPKVVFCLLCNYISKLRIDICNKCMHFHFHNMKYDDINEYLQSILRNEMGKITNEHKDLINVIIEHYYPDIRYMVNELQKYVNRPNHTQINIYNIKQQLFSYLCVFIHDIEQHNIMEDTIMNTNSSIYVYIETFAEHINTIELLNNMIEYVFDYLIENNVHSKLLCEYNIFSSSLKQNIINNTNSRYCFLFCIQKLFMFLYENKQTMTEC